jgi:hypothetical protein
MLLVKGGTAAENITPVLVNTSFKDHKSKIKSLDTSDYFVCAWCFVKADGSKLPIAEWPSFTAEVAEYEYDYTRDCYTTKTADCGLVFQGGKYGPGSYTVNIGTTEKPIYRTYRYVISNVVNGIPESILKHTNLQTFISFDDLPEDGCRIIDFQIFRAVNKGDDSDRDDSDPWFLSPFDTDITPKRIVEQRYYESDDAVIMDTSGEPTSGEPLPADKYSFKIGLDCKPVLYDRAQKVKAVEAKQSNYFNIIQSICETFECWADFEIAHDEDGNITSKKIHLKNYIDKDNFAGFRHGVNLKSISRTKSSKNFVSKLIVPSNLNEYGEGGICTIARSGLNETGESYLYDFRYYVNQGLLSQ